MKLRSLLFSLFLSFGCSSGQLKVAESIDSAHQIDKDTYSWVTWNECFHDIGDHPCNFNLMDQNGEIVDLYQHHNKVVILDFSSMWCGICNSIATKGDEFAAAYGDDNFIWITILIENSAGLPPDLVDLQLWTTTYVIESPVLAGDREMIDLSARDGYPITSWPTLAVIDRKMVIQYGINGWNESVVTGWVEELL
jgi:thiol-disulfide isomerase/thioredoxin